MESMIHEISPDCAVTAREVYLTPENIPEILDGLPRPDYVLDCIDTITQKLAIAQWCAERNIYLLSSMGAANKLDPEYLTFTNIRHTINCPMSRVIRGESYRRGIRGLEVLYSKEVPVNVANPGAHTKGGDARLDELHAADHGPDDRGQGHPPPGRSRGVPQRAEDAS